MEFKKVRKYEIYVGLKDQYTYNELFTMEDITKILKAQTSRQRIGFSVYPLKGGYEHHKGYTLENSVCICLVGAEEETVIRLGEWLKELVNTDTILYTCETIECAFV